MDERAFYSESNTTKPINLNCPYCKTSETYELKWVVRLKRDRLPGRADEHDRAKFDKAQSYMVLMDDKVACKNLRCRKRFDVSGVKTMAFLSPEQEASIVPQRDNTRAANTPRRDMAGDNRGNRRRDMPARANEGSGNRYNYGNTMQTGRRQRNRGRMNPRSPSRGGNN